MVSPTPVSGALGTYSLPQAAQGYFISQLAQKHAKPIILLCHHDRQMSEAVSICRFFLPDHAILNFPAWDCLPYDRSSPSPEIMAQRMHTLVSLSEEQVRAPIIITTLAAITQKIPPQSTFAGQSLHLEKGAALNRDTLLSYLTHHGYSRVSKVMEPGEYALRGSIIDLFPPSEADGVRLDLFGDEIESIKSFDVLSQISHGELESLTLQPVHELQLSEQAIARFREGYRHLFSGAMRDDPLYESISAGRSFQGMEHWLPLFYEKLVSLLDYTPDALLCLPHDLPEHLDDRLESIKDYYDIRMQMPANADAMPYHPLPPDALYLSQTEWDKLIAKQDVVTLTPFQSEKSETVARPAPSLRGSGSGAQGLEKLKPNLEARKTPCLFACYSHGSAERIAQMCARHNIPTCKVESAKELKNCPGNQLALAILPIETGFDSVNILLLSEQDVLGERVIRTQKRKRAAEAFMMEAASFGIGELIVHKEHGIGRFEGLETMEVMGNRHDCLKLVYAGEDKLFLPVENSEMITRFGSESDGVALDKLGGVAWQKRKASMKHRMKVAAEELLKIAAKRFSKEAPILVPNPENYEEFIARFPHAETEDQQRAIDDVLADFTTGRPMDRLICGDVGFGKTEVALRAAFAAVAADEPYQVAVIAPTTLLARQHYLNFKERFKGLPYEIRPLSRLVPAKDLTATKEKLASGKVDIVIGTHALLAKDMAFKNLGLVIVDEEQHFGVAQKERLKKLRVNTHMLTLSATPIPRTLQMALSGIRELSLITTPPVDRLAIRSFVLPVDQMVLREAIMREYHRGGKVFYVTPRIKYMAEIKQMLEEMVPEISICAAHGQMPPSQLDRVMNEFYDGKYDLLLSTAIIESGLDVPTANTIIIDHSELLGLAQLYQLRGRVGRGKLRAYAYFTLPHRKQLTAQATKRLEVMQTLDTLGAGFTLASHDMDIRGFGNLLGEEQSGHVREVGIELYQHMLEETIAQLKQQKDPDMEPPEDSWSPHINLGFSVLIPEEYIEDLTLRMSLYRRLAALDSDEAIDSFAAELIDRFGPLPTEVTQLLAVMQLKLLCKKAHIERLDSGPKGAVITFRDNRYPKPDALLAYITSRPKQYKIRQDHKLVYLAEWRGEKERVAKVNQCIAQLALLAA